MKILDIVPFEPKRNFDLNELRSVSILIKTLERQAHLKQLLCSIQSFGFKGPIIIADDSMKPYKTSILNQFEDLDISYIELPYDTGTAEGRNRMLEKVITPYFLLCDDDFVFDKRTRLPIMVDLLEKGQLDLLGGVFRQHNRKSRKGKYLLKLNELINQIGLALPSFQFYEYYAGFDIVGSTLSVKPIVYQDPITICDLTHNFFLAKTDRVKSFGAWNPILKGGEHQNFFIRAKLAGLKVGTTRHCGVIHDQWTENSSLYKELRGRGDEYKPLALSEFGIDKVIGYKEALGEDFFSK